MKIGERIGDYEIVEILGNGGMGEVYKVRNLLSERVEAMKVLLPNLAGDPDLAQRFLREIKLQASLDHPNIAKLHTAFRDSNRLLMVMEFVEGLSIERLLAHGPLLTHDAVNYTGQVLSALAYAHARGVVHRDIKPANLMRTPAGAIKLLDFGIAHLKKADNKLTKTGTTLGSLYYIAPELINGSEPDAGCDIYSLGVVLYEMVTGNKPFQGDSQYSIMTAHIQAAPVPPMEAVPWVPKALNDVILKAMAKDPADRFSSAEAFSRALDNAPAPDNAATQVMSAAPTQVIPATQVVPQTPMPVTAPPRRTQAMVTPAPSPAGPAAATPVAMPPQSRSVHRGLYVALGCFLTLGVLAAAAIGAPRIFKTRADSSGKKHAAAAQSGATEPAATESGASPTLPSNGQAPVTPSSSTSSTSSETASSSSNASSSLPASPSGPAPSASTLSAPVKPSAHEKPGSPSNSPSVAAQESYLAQMRELQEQAEQLDIRAKTVTASLTTLKEQMASQGLGLRSEVLEAEMRMNHLLGKAEKEIANGDAVSAERDLQMAGYTVDFIEKFLGR